MFLFVLFGIMGLMNRHLILGALAIVLIAGTFYWYTSRTALAPTLSTPAEGAASSTTPAVATSSQQGKTASVPPYKLSLVQGDTVASWNFQGAYTGKAELIQKAQTEMARLSAMLGSGQFTDYELYVSIANQYGLLGDGAKEFLYLNKALGIDSTVTGLAWENMGQLLSKLGAYRTAKLAFEKAVAAQPIPQYQQTLSDFLKEHPK